MAKVSWPCSSLTLMYKNGAKLWHGLSREVLPGSPSYACHRKLSSFIPEVTSLGTMPPTLSYLAAALIDSCKRMTEDFKGNADALPTISFDDPSSLCCHFTALAWQCRLCLTGSCCQKRKTGIFDVNNLVLFCISLVYHVCLNLVSQ